MGANSATKLHKIIDNLKIIAVIEPDERSPGNRLPSSAKIIPID